MKYFLTTTIAFFLCVHLIAQESDHLCSVQKQSYYNKFLKTQNLNYPGDETIDITYYKLDVKVSYSPQNVSGGVTVKGKSKVDNLSSLYLDFSDNMTVSNVSVGGRKVVYTRADRKIRIPLSEAINAGTEFTVNVDFGGRPDPSGFGSFEFSSHNGIPAIWSLSEPYGASDWFPCKDTPADKADSADIIITCDETLIPVSNGTLKSILNNGNGTHTYHWNSSYPIAQYLISLAITNYEVYKNYFVYNNSLDTMEVVHYNYPERLTAQRRTDLDRTIDMLHIFTDKFGEYPFLKEKYGHAEFGWGGGMEHQTISSMGSFGSGIVAHELAHQWFGDKITCKDWQHIWLNEGFATYSEATYYEEAYGLASYKSQIDSEMRSAKNARGSIYVRNITSVNEIFNGSRSYAKGAVVLHMLRGIVDKEIFYDILQTYISKPELVYGVATTEDFQSVAEEVSGIDLDYFFSEWIYGENYPVYSTVWSKTDLENNQYNVRLNIAQQTNTSPKFFTMPIQIKINTNQGDTLFTVFNNLNKQDFNLVVNGNPTSLEFDPDNWILKESAVVVGVEDENILPDQFVLHQNYPNPFNPVTKIKYSIAIPPLTKGRAWAGLVTLRIYDILGNEITVLVNEHKSVGNYEVEFVAGSLASGVYYYKLTSGNYSETKKMILLK
ncbi:MAG: T9SS type A sorting domain-containing protein [Bacteroidetes bacterium]|nr:T9SS type A sorting domain-containing protein [Bacteroidota bacterium]